MLYLASDRLRVEIAEPGEYPNNGFRFDRAGFLTEIILDGAHHFCASEPQNLAHPSSGGRGLCCEYKADYSQFVEDGEFYPKLGIGLIRKEGPYIFYRKYKELKEYPIDIISGKNYVKFVTQPVECLGYAARMEKIITVEDNLVVMDVVIDNVGEKEIISEEYCHNFLSIDGMAISPDYRLDFLSLKGLKPGTLPNAYLTPCNFIADETGISLARCETEVSLTDVPIEGTHRETPFSWILSHKGAKAKVEVCDEIIPEQITLWCADHMFSPEIIQKFSVKPGESFSWKRSWRFSRNVDK